MCWNKDVSLNTFLFSMTILSLVIYNNAYTKYKIEELNSVWVYVFLMSFVFMQLLEYFIWINIDNAFYNNLFSILASILLLLQPVASLLLIENMHTKTTLILLYCILAIPFSIYRFSIMHVNTSVSKMGHLQWNFLTKTNAIDNIILCIWFFFFFFSFYINNLFHLLVASILLLLAKLFYFKDKSIGSMWCWFVNSIFIYYAIYLLFFLPFVKK